MKPARRRPKAEIQKEADAQLAYYPADDETEWPSPLDEPVDFDEQVFEREQETLDGIIPF